MKLLICTQTVDTRDAHLGFFHAWIEEFAKHCEGVSVICLDEGAHTLPKHVRVYALGRGNRLLRAWKFLRYAYTLHNEYDSVFVHMNPEYAVLGGWYWRMSGKKVVLWYAHKSITVKLRLALQFVTAVCSVTSTSFPIATRKLHAVGHGIDTALFQPRPRTKSDTLHLVTAGRIAESKHTLEMLDVIEVLKRRGIPVQFSIVGGAGTPEEEQYKRRLIDAIQARGLRDEVVLYGAMPHQQLPEFLVNQDVFLNFGTTGNMDKAGFEPLVMGLPLVSTNTAFKELLSPWGLYVDIGNADAIADAVVRAWSMAIPELTAEVIRMHSLSALVPKLLPYLTP
jgi:glycosyltransferase involved in cell wall biosynthesis